MIKLSAKVRQEKPHRLRKEGRIPAVVYGYNQENTPLSVDEREFMRVYKKTGESSLISLDTEKGKSVVLVYDMQEEPMSGRVMHVDFYQPNMKEKVEAEIPIVFKGESPAVKDMDGTLVKSMSEVTVSALPQNLPSELEVDIGKLESFDDVIKVEDIEIPEGVEIINEPDWTVAMVSTPENVEEQLEKSIDESVGETEIEKEEEEEEGEE